MYWSYFISRGKATPEAFGRACRFWDTFAIFPRHGGRIWGKMIDKSQGIHDGGWRNLHASEWVIIDCLTSQSTIFQLYMWRHIYICRQTEEEVGPTVGLPGHRHFVGFFYVPIQAPTRGQPFMVIPRNRPISVAFYDAHGDTMDLFSSKTPGSTPGKKI